MSEFNSLDVFFRKDKYNFHKFRGKYVWEWGWFQCLNKIYNTCCTWMGGKNGIIYDTHKGLMVKDWFMNDIKGCMISGRQYIVGILIVKIK